MKLYVALAAVVLGSPAAVGADGEGPRDRLQVTYDAGALVALGGREGLLDDALLVGVTGSYDVLPHVAVVASVSRVRARGDGAWEGERAMYQYDAGVQVQLPLAVAPRTTLVPFAGAGLGARTFDLREAGEGLDTDLTAYLALGVRLEYRFAVVGLSARDLVSDGSRPWTASPRSARQDLAVLAAIGARF